MVLQLKPTVSTLDNIQGNLEAPITLVEYGDYQCPHCEHVYPIVKQLQKNLGDKLNFVFRNFPLKNIHVYAGPAAIASEAAGRQGKFWEMHDIIFENQRDLHGNSFVGFAEKIGLDVAQFQIDCEDRRIINKVEQDFESGMISGVNGTPTFFINGMRYMGSNELADLSAMLDRV